ncbi:MAG: YggU family protein [Chloroflexi bacterium]|nr:YggU family protein [Chloroflexota bacterium]
MSDAILAIHVTPRARRDEIVGALGESIRVKLRAPPVDDKANDALIKLLADYLEINRAQIEIIRGKRARQKWVRVRGARAEKIAALKK